MDGGTNQQSGSDGEAAARPDAARREQLRLTAPPRDPFVEALPRRRRPLGLSEHRIPRSLARRAAVARARVLLPAVAALIAGTIAAGIGQGLLLGGAVALVAAPLRRFPMPLHLMPTTRILLALIPAMIGCGIFALADLIGPRTFEIGSGPALFAALVTAEVALAIELVAPRWLRQCPMRIATLGSPEFALALEQELHETGVGHAEMIGWIDQSGAGMLRDVVLANRVDLVVRVSGPRGARSARLPTEDGFESLLDLPVRTIGADQLYEDLFGHVPMGTIDTRWYLYLLHPEFTSTRPLSDRVAELAVAIPVMVVAAPFVALAALAIKLTDRGPVMYRQTRVGAGGTEFEILKLRTMSATAEAAGAEWSGPADARVTRVGRVLRRLHMDELPQLLNVLRGDMTIVGPRPERPEMVADLERAFPHYRRRHLIKPGVTGWAQVRCGYAGSTLGTAWKLCHVSDDVPDPAPPELADLPFAGTGALPAD
jgi:lipopolysaccharide/colanic/teichoic acid biosynthesis glycosyltransferase